MPKVSLPTGGGAIKGISEKFEINAVNGTAGFSIPFPSSSARGFGTSLGISYNSGAGNGIFGLGWSLGVPSVRRKSDQELPHYLDETDSDTFIFSGEDDLVPKLKETASGWVRDEEDSPDGQFIIRKYRPRIDGSFTRIEQWRNKSDSSIHWRTISKDNLTSIYGDDDASRIADPANNKKIFEWLVHFTYDDKGNCSMYEYVKENTQGIDASAVHNKNRINNNSPFTNTYLKRVRSGNKNPYQAGTSIPAPGEFFFETVFDFGEHDPLIEPFNESQPWVFREDAFSQYRAGFEIRTCRLCHRVLLYHHFDALPGGSALISSLNFKYDNNDQQGNFNFLKEIISTGYIKHPDNSYTKNLYPRPLFFTRNMNGTGK